MKSQYYSITIRPKQDNFNILHKSPLFIPMLKDKLQKYIVSEERGTNNVVNHYQCYFQYSKEVRSDSVKRSILTVIKKYITLTDEEKKYFLKVKPIKTNLEGTIGYTLKEENTYHTNFTEEELEHYLKCYKEHLKNNSFDNKEYFRINPKNYHRIVERYIEEHECSCDTYDIDNIKDIIGEMINKGYYFTFLNKRNFDEKTKYLIHYLNKEGKKYLEYLEEAQYDI